MGIRALPVKPPNPVLRVLLISGGLICLLGGGLWILFFLSMLLFGGLDLGERVGVAPHTQASVILTLATLGLVGIGGGWVLLSRATGRR